MSESSQRWAANATRLFDIAVAMVCLLLAVAFTVIDARSMSLGDFLAMRLKLQNVFLMLALLAAWSALFDRLGLYRNAYFDRSRGRKVLLVLTASTLGTAMLWVLHLVFRIEAISGPCIAYFWVLASAMMLGGRATLRLTMGALCDGVVGPRNLVIIGTNKRALDFANSIESGRNRNYHLVGFVDVDWNGTEAFRSSGRRIISDFSGFGDLLRTEVVDEVVIFTPVSLYNTASQLLGQCEEQGIRVSFVPDLFTPRRGTVAVEQMGDHVVTTVDAPGHQGPAALVKRLLDIAVSGALIVLLSPLLLAVAVLVRITSVGPALFLQERVGLHKRRFKVFKFRTMSQDAERHIEALATQNEASGPVFKIRNDPRVTRLGAFLRKTSIDELPQLVNVFWGDMSLVGPRPLPVRDYEGFSQDWHRRRFSVRPGITCLWQIGGRSAITFDRWMELDMEYIDRWSLALDLKILLKTVPAVLRGSGAY
jgi:exopolysaccharide biosynthesis polyprenyl glycosylphosphotransferase